MPSARPQTLQMTEERRLRCADRMASGFRGTADVLLQSSEDEVEVHAAAKRPACQSSPPMLFHPTMDDDVDFLGSNSSDRHNEGDMSGAIQSSMRDIAYLQQVQQDIQGAGLDYNIILTMPDDIQSIVHRTALRRQSSRADSCSRQGSLMDPAESREKDTPRRQGSLMRQKSLYRQSSDQTREMIFSTSPDAMYHAERSVHKGRSPHQAEMPVCFVTPYNDHGNIAGHPRAPYEEVSPKFLRPKKRMSTQDSVSSVDNFSIPGRTYCCSEKVKMDIPWTGRASTREAVFKTASASAAVSLVNSKPFTHNEPSKKAHGKGHVLLKCLCM